MSCMPSLMERAMTTEKAPSKLDVCRELYAEGAFDPTIAAELGLTIKKFEELLAANPGFSEFVEMGRTLSMAWWYDLARRNVKNKTFNSATWSLVMKNQFGWADKVETKQEDMKLLDAGQLRSLLGQKLKELKKSSPELVKQLEASNA